MEYAEVTRHGVFDRQVCVPENWTDEQVLEWLNATDPSGTQGGWHIRREGDPALAGDPERVACLGRAGFVHIMLDA